MLERLLRHFNRGGLPKFLLLLLSNGIVLLLTWLSTPGGLKVSEPMLKWITIDLFLALFLSWIVFYLFSIRRDHREAAEIERIRRVLPNLVSMLSRRDVFVIQANGDATVHWKFEIELGSGASDTGVRTMSFPVYADRSAELAPQQSAVEVLGCRIDNGDFPDPQRLYHRLHDRLPLPSAADLPTMECGEIQIPVNLNDKHRRRTAEVSIRLRGAFHRETNTDFAIVEIPCVTEKLRVTIRTDDKGYCVRAPLRAEPAIVAFSSGIAGNRDMREISVQNDLWEETYDELEWRTEHPKLGYQYNFSFALLKAEQP
jgi:hypothetical protein